MKAAIWFILATVVQLALAIVLADLFAGVVEYAEHGTTSPAGWWILVECLLGGAFVTGLVAGFSLLDSCKAHK